MRSSQDQRSCVHWRWFETLHSGTNIIIPLSILYTVLCRRTYTLPPPSFLFHLCQSFKYAHILRMEMYVGKEREKRSRMDSAMLSWCNCMLIERTSEYGIRMKAVRFDIAFCLRSSPLRSSFTSFFVIRSSPPYPSFALTAVSFSADLSKESAVVPLTLHKNWKWSVLSYSSSIESSLLVFPFISYNHGIFY